MHQLLFPSSVCVWIRDVVGFFKDTILIKHKPKYTCFLCGFHKKKKSITSLSHTPSSSVWFQFITSEHAFFFFTIKKLTNTNRNIDKIFFLVYYGELYWQNFPSLYPSININKKKLYDSWTHFVFNSLQKIVQIVLFSFFFHYIHFFYLLFFINIFNRQHFYLASYNLWTWVKPDEAFYWNAFTEWWPLKKNVAVRG